ncbi:response regulator [Pararhizobium mangrovi]|uniref:Response regulator n=1 Tax=Pararhizobium mangrovi TaxID=2590452 RepID=A0A506U0N9_9HYPH|nr:response regulator [Pararhizobium mangrovi]TPW26544.1 response regulator [Pararhizobium mangrovi]
MPTPNDQTQKRSVILIVEDEPILRMQAVDMIEDAGFEAIEAHDAAKAVEILENRLDIRVVFTDVDMPGTMDGLKLAALIRDRWPPIKLIVTSGIMDSKDIVIPAEVHFYPKPYREREIIEQIQCLAC